MAEVGKRWPEGLNDEEAIERFEALMLQACEGNKDLSNGREYKLMRAELLRRDDLADVVPQFIRSQRDLNGFWAYIKNYSGQWEPRRQHVRDSFRPLFDRVEGRSSPPIKASRWTGRRTAYEQAVVVRSLAPDALISVETLLEEQERGLGNGGPVDSERRDAINTLKELREQLSELIRLAENELPLEHQLSRINDLKNRAFKWMASPIGFGISNLPLTGSSLAIGLGVMHLINAIGIGQGAAFGTTTMAAHVAANTIKRGKTDGGEGN